MSLFHSGATASATPIKRRGLLSYSAAAIAMTAMLSASPAAMATDPSGPTAPIEQLDTALLAAMRAGQNTPFAQRYAMLAPAVEQAYDLHAVLAAAVGPAWFSMTSAQKAALEPAFQRYTISDYTANFDSYDGQNFRVLPQTRTLPDGDVVVRTQIERRNKSPVTPCLQAAALPLWRLGCSEKSRHCPTARWRSETPQRVRPGDCRAARG
jgi:ABC-type transporter MlaC component